MNYIVAGGGAVGLATAQVLLQAGHAVVLLERGTIGQEASWAGGGILSPLCPWDYSDAVTRLATRGAVLFEAWVHGLREATGIDPEYEQSGMLVLPPCDAQLAQQWCARNDVPLRQVNAADYDLQLPGDALLLPQVAQVRNPRLLQALRKQVEMLGGHIVENCAVQEFEAEGGRVRKLLTSCGEYSADGYIVTAGAWSKQVLGQYALDLDIKPVRGQMLLYRFDTPPLPHIVLQKDLYLIPRRDGHLLVGSTLEDVGFDKSTTTAACAELMQRAQRLLPQLRDMPVVQQWAGLRPGSPHNVPTIGRHPHLENLYLNSGHFRYGVTMAPASAEILLNELTGATQPFDVAPYASGWGV
ncbi:MAG: glycine oxidase ThiO [Sideroxydans sp.]|nr:glycine oxidase ThiO [Sideroxydans sp.]